MRLIESALELKAKGFIPVPVLKGQKRLDVAAMGFDPIHLKTMQRSLERLVQATVSYTLAQEMPDTATVVRWFAGREDGNLGILAGFADLLILDIDGERQFRMWEKKNAGLLASSPIAKTPHGYHVYLKCTEPLASTSLFQGLHCLGHLKALGGYVVASPSTLQNGSKYHWLLGHSPFELEPPRIASLKEISVQPLSVFKRFYYARLTGARRD